MSQPVSMRELVFELEGRLILIEGNHNKAACLLSGLNDFFSNKVIENQDHRSLIMLRHSENITKLQITEDYIEDIRKELQQAQDIFYQLFDALVRSDDKNEPK